MVAEVSDNGFYCVVLHTGFCVEALRVVLRAGFAVFQVVKVYRVFFFFEWFVVGFLYHVFCFCVGSFLSLGAGFCFYG